MLEKEVITKDTRAYVTHINPVGSFSSREYQDYMDAHAPVSVTVAWDGLEAPW